MAAEKARWRSSLAYPTRAHSRSSKSKRTIQYDIHKHQAELQWSGECCICHLQKEQLLFQRIFHRNHRRGNFPGKCRHIEHPFQDRWAILRSYIKLADFVVNGANRIYSVWPPVHSPTTVHLSALCNLGPRPQAWAMCSVGFRETSSGLKIWYWWVSSIT